MKLLEAAADLDDGTHKSEEPVSKSMRKVWAGVPSPMAP